MPDAQFGAWPADAWASYGGGGGSITDLTAPAAIDPVALVAGTTALTSTAIGSWSASVTVTASGTDDTGSAAPALVLSGSGAGPYSATIASGLVSGRTYTYDIEGDDGAGQVARTSLTVAVAAAAASGATLEENIDTTALSAYDFLTTGGTSGTGGEGAHDVGAPGGNVSVTYEGTSGPTELELVGGALRYTATASDYAWVTFPLLAEAPNATHYVTVEWTLLTTVTGAFELFAKIGAGGTANVAGEVRVYNDTASSIVVQSVNGSSSFETAFSQAGLTMTAGQTVRVHIVFMGGAVRGFVDQTSGEVAWPSDPSSYSTHTRTGSYDTPTATTVLCSRSRHEAAVYHRTDTPSA